MLRSLLWLVLSLSVLEAAPYEIIHYPRTSYSLQFPFQVDAIFSGDVSQVLSARVLGRQSGSSIYREFPMDFDGLNWSVTIPTSDFDKNGYEYLIVFQLKNEGLVTFPEHNPFSSPQKCMYDKDADANLPRESDVEEDVAGGSIESGVIILSPEPGSKIAVQDLVITLSLFNTPDADLSSLKIFLDKTNLTSFAVVTPEVITLTPLTGKLKSGTHSVEVRMNNNFGAAFKPLVWSFELVADITESEKVFKSDGKISLEYRNENLDGIRNNLMRGKLNYNGSAAQVSYGATLNLVDNESPEFQPRNQYAAFINSDYMDLELGDCYPLFTRTALWGSRIRGAHANLKFGLFNFQFVTGASLRKVNGSAEFVDSLQTWNVQDYTYGRNVIGIKPSFGSEDRFNVYLSVVQTRDDTSSIYPPDFIDGFDPLNQSYRLTGAKPRDNLVIGFGHSLILDNRKFNWYNDIAISLSNSDISRGALDSIAFGDTTLVFSDLMGMMGFPLTTEALAPVFIINENTGIPIPIALTKDMTVQVSPLTFSAYPTLAWMSQFQLDYYGHYVNINYKRVAPEYQALAHNGIMSDNKVLDLSDRIRMLDNKLFLNLNYNSQRDNLLEGVKQYTSDGRSTSIGLNIMPGPGFPTATISMKVLNRFNNASRVDTLVMQSTDTTSLNPVSYSFSDPRINNQSRFQMLNVSQPFRIFGKKNSLNISYISSDRRDLVPNRPVNFMDISMGMEALTLTAITTLSPVHVQALSYSRTRNISAGTQQYNYNIMGYKLDSKLFADRISNSVNLKYTRAFGLVNFWQITAGDDIRMKILQNQLLFSFQFNKIVQDVRSANSLKFYLKYSITF